jgi:CubicO group peptidase (beta-lactamase class C family)
VAVGRSYRHPIAGVDQPLLSFFPERTAANGDPRKEAITLEHLLTSTSGLRSGRPNDAAGNQIQQVLDRPMEADPGTTFGYYSSSYLSSAVLQASTGTDALTFAKEHLFEPLGISDVSWESDSDGVCTPIGLQMTSHDLAKFGHLYLNDGVWDGQQIVPAEWVARSTQRYTSTGCNLGFGYQWWIHGFGAYAAQSGRAQSFVVQDLGLLTVSTSQPGGGQAMVAGLVEYFIVPAVKSSEPLPENPAAVAKVESLVEEIERLAES